MRFAVGVIFSWEKTPRLLECQKVPPKAYGQIGWHKEEINAVEMWRGGGRRERCWPPTPFKPNITASIDSNQVLKANAARLNAIHLHLHKSSRGLFVWQSSPIHPFQCPSPYHYKMFFTCKLFETLIGGERLPLNWFTTAPINVINAFTVLPFVFP